MMNWLKGQKTVTLKFYSLEEIAELLRDEGYRKVEMTDFFGTEMVRVSIDGRKILIGQEDNGDLQLMEILTDVPNSSEAMNEINASVRGLKAHQDELFTIFQMTLFTVEGYGISKEHILQMLKTFLRCCAGGGRILIKYA
ncbi:YbjN domain-containing protein [Neisseria bergeri]|uniref:YbjN domain-containing protein n=2 Tax=Neisseria bergeri TaxID=1906581 RepID=UPI0027E0880C|nr:YbjN domain-containing protein [Neisseria bergeri]